MKAAESVIVETRNVVEATAFQVAYEGDFKVKRDDVTVVLWNGPVNGNSERAAEILAGYVRKGYRPLPDDAWVSSPARYEVNIDL